MKVKVVKHPLIEQKLTNIRKKETNITEFRQNISGLVSLLCFEASKSVETVNVKIETPIEKTDGVDYKKPLPLIVPILRAGLGMLEGILHIIPNAPVGFLGMKRDEETLEIETYAERIPSDLTDRHAIVVDPMLATGSTIVETIKYLNKKKVSKITLICILAAPEGIEHIDSFQKKIESVEVELFVGSIDRQLNSKAYIVPGLGDAGDRLYGTVD
jgi:uracil phosphoribosyltransferase